MKKIVFRVACRKDQELDAAMLDAQAGYMAHASDGIIKKPLHRSRLTRQTAAFLYFDRYKGDKAEMFTALNFEKIKPFILDAIAALGAANNTCMPSSNSITAYPTATAAVPTATAAVPTAAAAVPTATTAATPAATAAEGCARQDHQGREGR
jgi:hypothetical protein